MLVVGGCGNPQAEAINKAAICDARTAVVAAVGDVERAVNAAIAGDSQTARDKAGAAGSRIKLADQLLKGLPADAQPADARVALLDGGIQYSQKCLPRLLSKLQGQQARAKPDGVLMG